MHDEDVLRIILSFLSTSERARSNLVARKWRRVSQAQEQQQQQQEREEMLSQFTHKYEIRQANRNEMAKIDPDRLEELDQELGAIVFPSGRRSRLLEYDLSSIARLLDQGAIPPDQRARIFADACAISLESLDEQEYDHVLLLLRELFCSSFSHWNFSLDDDEPGFSYDTFPHMLKAVTFWWVHNWDFRNRRRIEGFSKRWKAWNVFRLMIHSAQLVGDQDDFHQFCHSYLSEMIPFYLIDGPPCSSLDIYFIQKYIAFMLTRIDFSFLAELFSRGQFLLLAVPLENPLDYARLDWDKVFRYIWSSKNSQQFLVSRVKQDRGLRLWLIQHEMEPLCRRKDRKLMQLLFVLESHAMAGVLETTLSCLRRTRGKTERLIAYFSTVQTTAQNRQRLLQELQFASSREE